ncbi:ABC transporter permease [Nocardioides humi]|uniref:Iron ABC transporter permease n=1 Tax=Nocardioides humi TaxID=449461 RepID=A0ABN2AF57_9ACTN|nr:iron ABC transporter permease [Nocardioides humi]
MPGSIAAIGDRLRKSGGIATAVRLGACLVIVAVLAGPMLAVVYGAFRSEPPGIPGEWTLDSVRGMFDDPSAVKSLRNTALIVVTVVPLAMAIALYFAWTAARTNTPLRWLITPAMALSLAVPPLFFALSWRLVGNESSGLLAEISGALPLVPELSFDAESMLGLILVSAVKLAPFLYFIIIGPVMAMDSTQEEASRLSNAGPFVTFVRVTLPALAPALLGASLLAVVICLEFFEIPLLLGTAPRIRVISTEIYDQINNSMPPDYSGGFALALLPIVAVIGIVVLQRRVIGNRSFQTVGGKGSRATVVDLRRGRVPNLVVMLVALLVLAVLPIAQLVVGSLQPIFGLDQGHYGLQSYRAVLDQPQLREAVTNSLLLGTVGGGIAMVLALVLSMTSGRRNATRVDRLVGSASWLPWAAPGIILSIGIYSVFLVVPGLARFYGSIWIMLAGLIISVMPVAARAAEGGVAQLSWELQDAARTSGAGPLRVFTDVVVRLLLPTFLAGWLISAVVVAGNLSVVIMLGTPSSTPTVPVMAYRLMTAGNMSQAAALFLVFMACIAAVSLVLAVAQRLARAAVTGRAPRVADTPVPGAAAAEPIAS